MFLLRIIIIAFVIGYFVWFINNRILGKNLALARVISATLVVTSVVYLVLGILSYVVEGSSFF
jgi:hypothetical protein